MAKALNYNLNFKANTKEAETALKQLQMQLEKISLKSFKIDSKGFKEAQADARKLQQALNFSTTSTGKLDLTKFNSELKKSGLTVNQLSKQMLSLGVDGEKAFASFAKTISSTQTPIRQTSKMLDEMWVTMKNTMRWQFTTAALGGFTGAISDAVSYAHQLDSALRDIRIVSGESAESMEQFAVDASKAAKRLSSTTKDYAEGALIYYQQGLDQEESRARTETTLKMANVTGDSASEVSSYMTAIWNNYAKGSENLEHFTDVMADLGARTASSSSEIADGLQQFVSLGPVIGLSFDNAAAALAAVSSSTRESAATIGNSFKTIFARLQGLKLGDTLDDGTDLNKYSEALATAGVQIKDSTGQLKDADTILDELMDKWDGLAKDQQVATAQTVAGVHQYARFMSLMEAKDAYRQNLQWAQNADGAVDEQMKYYEESWTAAQDRFKDSLNQVYNQLDIEDGAKTLYNVLDKIASGAAEAIDNVGGIQPIFFALASFLGGTFSSQISNTFSRFKQNIITTITSEEQLKQAHQEMLNVIQEKKDGIGSVAIQKEIEGYEQLIQLKQKVANASKNLSSDEIAYNDAVLQSVEQLLLKEKELRELRVEKEDTYQDLPEDTFNNFAKTVKGGNILRGENGLGGANEERVSAFYNSRNVENNINASNETRIRELIDNVLQLETANAQATASFKRVEEAGKTFSSANEKDINKVRESYAKLLQDIKDDFPLLVKELKKADVDIVDSIESITAQSLEEIKKNIEETKRNLSNLRSNVQRSANLGGQALSGLNINPKKLREAAEEQVNIINQQRETSGMRQNLNDSVIEKPVKKDTVKQILMLNSALSQTAFAMMSVRSIWKDLKDPDISGWEKLTSVLINIGFITPTIMSGIKGINTIIGKKNSLKNIKVDEDIVNKYSQQAQDLQEKINRKNKINISKEGAEQAAVAANEHYIQSLARLSDAKKEAASIDNVLDNAEKARIQNELSLATVEHEQATFLKEKTALNREALLAEEAEIDAQLAQAVAADSVTVSRTGEMRATTASIATSKVKELQNAGEAVSEELVNAALSEGITLQNVDIAVKYKGVAATVAAALAQGQFAVALKAVGVALKGIITAAAPFLPLIVAIGGAIAIFKVVKDAMNEATDNAQEQSDKLQALQENLSNVNQEYEGLKEAQSTYDEAKSGLDGLVQGTQEWNEALEEANNKILEILNNYPELWAYASRDENGLISIDDEGFEELIEKKQEAARKAEAAKVVQQQTSTKADNDLLAEQAGAKWNNEIRDIYSQYSQGQIDESQVRSQVAQQEYEDFNRIEEKLKGINKESAEYREILANNGLSVQDWEEKLTSVDEKTKTIIENANKAKSNSTGADNAMGTYLSSLVATDEDFTEYGNQKQITEALEASYQKKVKEIRKNNSDKDIREAYERETTLKEGDKGYQDNVDEQAKVLAAIKMTKEEAQEVVDQVNSDMQQLQSQVWGESGGGLLGQMLTGNGSAEGYTLEEISKLKSQLDTLMSPEQWANANDEDVIRSLFGVDSETAKEIISRYGTEAIETFVNAVKNFVKADKKDFDPVEQAADGNEEIKDRVDDIKKAYDKLPEDEKKVALEVIPKMTEDDAKSFIKDSKGYIKKYSNDLKAEETFANITKEIDAAKDAGDTYNFDATDVKNYAKQLQNLARQNKIANKELKDNYDLALQVAYSYQKMNDGLEKIRSNWDDWKNIFKTVSPNNSEYQKTLTDYAGQMEKVLGMQLNDLENKDGEAIKLDFLVDTESLKLAEQALNGDADAVDRLKAKAQEKIFFEVYADEIDDSGMRDDLAKMANLITGWVSNHNIEVGASIDNSQFNKALYSMAAATGQTVADIARMFGFTVGGKLDGYDTIQVKRTNLQSVIDDGGMEIDAVSGAASKTATKFQKAKAAGYATVMVPRLSFGVTNSAAGTTGSVPKGVGTTGSKGGGSGKSKGGGGGGSSNKYEPDKLDDEFDKYYYYKKSIEDLGKAYDKLSAARDRAYEPKKYYDDTASMNANIEARIRVYDNYIKVLDNDVKFDKKFLTGLGAKFDSWGNMTNYEAFMKNRMANYQMRLNKAGNDDAASKIKDQWEIEKGHVEAWQERHDTLTDARQAREELKNTLIDNKLDSFQFELDVNTDKADVALDHISSRLSHLDHYKLNVSLLVDAQEDELGEMLNKLEYQRHYLRQLNVEAATDGMNKNLQDAINEAKKNIDSLVTDIENKVDDIGNDIQKIFDDLDDRLDSTKNRISSFSDILNNMKDIINLSGQKYTKNETFKALQYSIQQTNKQNVELLKGQVDAQKDIVQKLKNARKELADQGADEAVLKQWDDKIKEAEEQYTSLGAELTSALQDSISNIMDAAVEALEDAMKKAEMKLFNIGDLEMAKNYYEEYQDLSEEYLDNTEKTYELGKLMRQINNSIADKNNVAGAKELAELADEVTKKQEKGVKLSQYDVDLLNAKYQLTLAQIALEEAQNNKTTMRLRRDASGNYSYVYTADADAISNAEQNVEDKQKNLYDISKDYEEKIAASWFDVLQQYEERVQELQEKYQAGIITQTEFNKQKEALDDIYKQKIEYIYGELNKVYENSTLTFKDSNLQKATSMNELVDIYNKSNEFIKDISTDATQNAKDQADAVTDILGSVGIEVGKLADAFNTANTDINSSVTSMVASAKTSLAEFNASLDTSIQKIKEYAAAASAAFDKTGDAYVATGDVTGFTGDLSKQYMNAVAKGDMELANQLLEARKGKMAGMDANTLSSLINDERLQKWTTYYNNPDSAYYEAAHDMLDYVNNGGSALQWWLKVMNKITQDNPYKKPSSFDSGGYTGPWGSEGKLALLHEKELILNKTDTENILDAVNIIRSMSQSITSSLVNDLVDLVASWNRLTTNVNSSTEKIPQVITIDATFPNVSVASEIEEAFNDLANQAAQFASIKRV